MIDEKPRLKQSVLGVKQSRLSLFTGKRGYGDVKIGSRKCNISRIACTKKPISQILLISRGHLVK